MSIQDKILNLIPDSIAWAIVRVQLREHEHVKVVGLITKYIGAGLKFQHPQTGVSYRAHAVRRMPRKHQNDPHVAYVMAERMPAALQVVVELPVARRVEPAEPVSSTSFRMPSISDAEIQREMQLHPGLDRMQAYYRVQGRKEIIRRGDHLKREWR